MTFFDKNGLDTDIKFKYPDPNDPVLANLKNSADIVLINNTNSFQMAKIIIGYCHNLFTHNGDNKPTKNDPLTILNEAKNGSQFRCVEYCLLAVGLLWAYKIPARIIGLKTRDVETRDYGAGHVVIEFWDNDQKKWVMCDVQWGCFPISNGKYLSALELKDVVKNSGAISYELVDGSRFKSNFKENDDYTLLWLKDYLYFIDTPEEINFKDQDRSKQKIVMLVPEGVVVPKRFQNAFEMNAIYTYSATDFYPKHL